LPPTLALFLWFVFLVALLRFDPAKEGKISPTLWVPLISMFIVASRTPSQWLSGGVSMSAASLQDGNPLDRVISAALILLAIGILGSRSFNFGSFLSRNLALMAFLSFALLSVLWSDFPLIALKRWFRDLGNYLMVLVVLSDPHPLEAVRVVLRRVSYLLISLSVLLIKYYPLEGKQWEIWSGADSFVGATTSKNMLGVACLVSGLFFFWDIVTRWPERKQRRTKRIILVNVAFIAMTAWLLHLASSTTSTVCLGLGCLVIAAAHTRSIKRRPFWLKVLVPASFCLYLVLSFGFDMNGTMAGAVGKDPTLTDRTKIWTFLLGMHTNPLIGTGYESFWLGTRLETFWRMAGLGHINEAHNGYLEVYLNLGLMGLFFLGGFVIASYRTICKRLQPFSSLASLTLALWIAMLFYSVTEAGFRGGLMWLTFLLAGIAVPERAAKRVRVAAFDDVDATAEQLPKLRFETASVRAARWSER
jgi:exopolysaccharide production protein ExoQ